MLKSRAQLQETIKDAAGKAGVLVLAVLAIACAALVLGGAALVVAMRASRA